MTPMLHWLDIDALFSVWDLRTNEKTHSQSTLLWGMARMTHITNYLCGGLKFCRHKCKNCINLHFIHTITKMSKNQEFYNKIDHVGRSVLCYRFLWQMSRAQLDFWKASHQDRTIWWCQDVKTKLLWTYEM